MSKAITSTNHRFASEYNRRKYALVQKQNNHYPKGSQGIKDATLDSAKVNEQYEDNPNLNPNLATGQKSGIGVFLIHMNDAVNGAKSLAKLQLPKGQSLTKLLERDTKFFSKAGYFVLPYKLGSGDYHSKKAVLPGVDFFGEYDCIPLPPSSYKEGFMQVAWEWAESDSETPDPKAKYLDDVERIPDFFATLIEQKTPFDKVKLGNYSLSEQQKLFKSGFKGENCIRDFHDSVCCLRALGQAMKDIKLFVDEAVQNSDAAINKKWANQCIRHVCFSYEPVQVKEGNASISDLYDAVS
jgi:hypothetical protein